MLKNSNNKSENLEMEKLAGNSPVAGFKAAFAGMCLIFKPGLRRYVAVPFLINLVVFSTMIWFGAGLFESLLDRWLPEESWLSYFRWILWPLFALAFTLIVFYTFTIIANLIGAPFNDMLAAKAELMLTGQKPDEGADSLFAAVGPAVKSELQKLAYFLPRAFLLLVLFLIPGVNALAPLAWGLFSAWSLALEYTEYPFGNNGIRFGDQRELMKNRRLTSLAFGSGVMILMLIPGLNFFAMPAAVAGATALWVDRIKSEALVPAGSFQRLE
jgi:CysZ protein